MTPLKYDVKNIAVFLLTNFLNICNYNRTET